MMVQAAQILGQPLTHRPTGLQWKLKNQRCEKMVCQGSEGAMTTILKDRGWDVDHSFEDCNDLGVVIGMVSKYLLSYSCQQSKPCLANPR